MRTNQTATAAQASPVTITLEGELAARIRAGAKQMGMRPNTFGRMCVDVGDLLTADEPKSKEFQVAIALSILQTRGRRFVEVRDGMKGGAR